MYIKDMTQIKTMAAINENFAKRSLAEGFDAKIRISYKENVRFMMIPNYIRSP